MDETTTLFAAPDGGSHAESDLAAACRYAAELIRLAGGPPRSLSIRGARTAIEIEWPVTDGHPSVRPATEQAGSQHNKQWPGDDREYIRAPLVGTFYRAAQPGGTPFVEVGDYVEPGTQVGIVEAMKLMNPVEADRAGRVAEFVSPDGAAIEYGQPLIAIVPSA